MDGSSLIVAVMPIMTLIAPFTGITLPFVAGSRSGRHAGGPRARADARKRIGAAGRTAPPPAFGPDDAAPAGFLYVPCTASPTTATRPRLAAGSNRCPSSRRRPS